MPLYTYVVTYRGGSYVAQASHSNFSGFGSEWAEEFPKDALPALTPALRRELSIAPYRGTFTPIPNREHVWKKALTLGGHELVVYAIQTVR
jgi:hypothetical protein